MNTQLHQDIDVTNESQNVMDDAALLSEPTNEDRNAGGQDRRTAVRMPLHRLLTCVPMLPDGRPDQKRWVTGVVTDASIGGLGLEIEAPANGPIHELMVGVQGPDGQVQFAGVCVRNQGTHDDKMRVGCQFGGVGQQLLRSDIVTPVFVRESLTFASPWPEEVLQAWTDAGVLQPCLVDRVQLCPKCQGIPTFRAACRKCGSADVGNDLLIHHFACAHVGMVADFESGNGLICPKCRTRHLIVGSDFEFLTGPYRCHQCHWSDMELEQVGQCLECGHRFPGHQARLHDLRGYRVNRLDPLALLPTS